jgi:hypothetical protein
MQTSPRSTKITRSREIYSNRENKNVCETNARINSNTKFIKIILQVFCHTYFFKISLENGDALVNAIILINFTFDDSVCNWWFQVLILIPGRSISTPQTLYRDHDANYNDNREEHQSNYDQGHSSNGPILLCQLNL